MNTSEVMQDYNLYERMNLHSVEGDVIASPNIVKLVSPHSEGSYISYFNLQNANLAEQIDKQKKFFHDNGKSFEWKVYSTDLPLNIGECLIQKGFIQGDAETFMVLDLKATKVPEFDSKGVIEVFDARGIRDAVKVQEHVWGGNLVWQYQRLSTLKRQRPDSISIYVVYVGSEPVTSAWITFTDDSPFASIWGGSTIHEHRNKGYYTRLLKKRISEAKARGRKYLTIDARESSKPIVAKYGFTEIAKTVGYYI